MLFFIQFLNILESGFVIAKSRIFNILIDMSSYPRVPTGVANMGGGSSKFDGGGT